jgi:hypothetical protein
MVVSTSAGLASTWAALMVSSTFPLHRLSTASLSGGLVVDYVTDIDANAELHAALWLNCGHDLGLHVGRAFSGHSKYRGTFQRFTRWTLIAVGDDSRLSNRQMVNLKSNRRRRDTTSKPLK